MFTGDPGAAWEHTLRAVGAATGRGGAADDLIADFTEQARQTGVGADAAHYQASVVQLTENTVRVYGADNFPGSVLATVGVDRPAAQRFTDKPYVEIGTGDADLADADFSAADADIVYRVVRLPGRQGTRRQGARQRCVAQTVGESGQPGVRRQQRGLADRRGVVAARGILADLRWLNAPIN